MSLPALDAVQQLLLAQAQPAMSFDLVHMWGSMGPFAKGIAVVLFIMMVYAFGMVAERMVTFGRAGFLVDLERGATANAAPQKHAPFVVVAEGMHHLCFRRPPGTNLHLAGKDPSRWPATPDVVFEERDARDAWQCAKVIYRLAQGCG